MDRQLTPRAGQLSEPYLKIDPSHEVITPVSWALQHIVRQLYTGSFTAPQLSFGDLNELMSDLLIEGQRCRIDGDRTTSEIGVTLHALKAVTATRLAVGALSADEIIARILATPEAVLFLANFLGSTGHAGVLATQPLLFKTLGTVARGTTPLYTTLSRSAVMSSAGIRAAVLRG